MNSLVTEKNELTTKRKGFFPKALPTPFFGLSKVKDFLLLAPVSAYINYVHYMNYA